MGVFVDLEKAFDTVDRTALWQALAELGFSHAYINTFKSLYSVQTATVFAGKESRRFELQQGVKQGDPISSLLFIAVMEVIFRAVKKRWSDINTRRTVTVFAVFDNCKFRSISFVAIDSIVVVSEHSTVIGFCSTVSQ